MFPLGLVVGAVAGAAAMFVLGSDVTRRARPAAKAALKAALIALHEARVQGAQFTEAAEDLFAEAKSEAATDIFAAAVAAAQAKAAVQASQGKSPQSEADAAPKKSAAARKRTAVKRSQKITTPPHG